MERNPTFVPVVAAAIRDGEGRLLLQQCGAHNATPGCGMSPGQGGIRRTPRFALCREVAEELALELADAASSRRVAEEAAQEGRPRLSCSFTTCPEWSGSPMGARAALGMVHRDRAGALPMTAMDRALLARLHPELGPDYAKLPAPAYVPPSRAPVAQLDRAPDSNLGVGGSNPSGATKLCGTARPFAGFPPMPHTSESSTA